MFVFVQHIMVTPLKIGVNKNHGQLPETGLNATSNPFRFNMATSVHLLDCSLRIKIDEKLKQKCHFKHRILATVCEHICLFRSSYIYFDFTLRNYEIPLRGDTSVQPQHWMKLIRSRKQKEKKRRMPNTRNHTTSEDNILLSVFFYSLCIKWHSMLPLVRTVRLASLLFRSNFDI